jgi:hypothetical protein
VAAAAANGAVVVMPSCFSPFGLEHISSSGCCGSIWNDPYCWLFHHMSLDSISFMVTTSYATTHAHIWLLLLVDVDVLLLFPVFVRDKSNKKEDKSSSATNCHDINMMSSYSIVAKRGCSTCSNSPFWMKIAPTIVTFLAIHPARSGSLSNVACLSTFSILG